jgi:glycosyltransferase involved in cell wall biosynthesis
MPGYNEGETIFKNLIETEKILSQFVDNFEIVFVNDGSTDDTIEQVTAVMKKCNKIRLVDSFKNQGKGNALQKGVACSRGNYIAFLDSDLDLNPSQLEHYFEIMKEKDADVVIGSKFHPESSTNYPAIRKVISFCYYMMLMIMFRLNVRDTQTGIKLFKANVIKPVMEKILVKRYAYDIEVLAVLNRQHYKIVSAPINLVFKRQQNLGRIRINDLFVTFRDTLAIFYRLYILKYYDRIQDEQISDIVGDTQIQKTAL